MACVCSADEGGKATRPEGRSESTAAGHRGCDEEPRNGRTARDDEAIRARPESHAARAKTKHLLRGYSPSRAVPAL